MPPLCAVGYGVANASMPVIASAFYEFAINIVFIALGAETILLALHVPLKRDINDNGVVTPDEERRIIALSRKMRRLIIAATAIFALPCIAITAENVGANGTVLDDGYSVIATTRELSSVLPGFVRYGIGWETSTSNGIGSANPHLASTGRATMGRRPPSSSSRGSRRNTGSG